MRVKCRNVWHGEDGTVETGAQCRYNFNMFVLFHDTRTFGSYVQNINFLQVSFYCLSFQAFPDNLTNGAILINQFNKLLFKIFSFCSGINT